MKPIQILIDEELISALDREAKNARSNRSHLIRQAVVSFLAELKRRRREEEHRRGYQKHPQSPEELAEWEAAQKWPED